MKKTAEISGETMTFELFGKNSGDFKFYIIQKYKNYDSAGKKFR